MIRVRRSTDIILEQEQAQTYKLVVLLPWSSVDIGESRIEVVPFGLPVPEINCQLKQKNTTCNHERVN